MIEVKYPNNYGLDGMVHQIEIKNAYEVEFGDENLIIIYGLENNKIIIFEIKYLDSIKNYVFIPHDSMRLLTLTSPFLNRNEITEKIISKLDKKRITNIDEIKYKFGNENNLVLAKSIVESNKTIEEKRNINLLKNNYELIKEKNTKEEEIDVSNLFSYHKKNAISIIKEFLIINKGNYQNQNIEIIIFTLMNKIMDTIINLKDFLFTEDDLIDLGVLLANLNFKRINDCSFNKISEIINNGYDFNSKIKERVNKNIK